MLAIIITYIVVNVVTFSAIGKCFCNVKAARRLGKNFYPAKIFGCVAMIMHNIFHHLTYAQSFGSLITFEGQVLFDSNSNHPEGFSGVLHLAAFGQIMLRSGVNMTFTNNTGA